MIEQNGMIYSIGYISGENKITGTMAKLDTANMSVTYETLPDEIWNGVVDFAVTDNGIYIISYLRQSTEDK